MHEVEEEEEKKNMGGVRLCVALRWHVYAFITKQPLVGITSKFPSIDSARIAPERSVMFNSARVKMSCSAGRVLDMYTHIDVYIYIYVYIFKTATDESEMSFTLPGKG